MKEELQSTCHFDKINDVCFPARFSKVFLTCSKSDIRVWDRAQKTELLRIQVGFGSGVVILVSLSCDTQAWPDANLTQKYRNSLRELSVARFA